MNAARNARGILTINNIVEACDDNPDLVFEQIQSIIDAPEMDIPDEAASAANVIKLQTMQSYYANQYPYLIGLWGRLRHATGRADTQRVAMRDYLEKAVSACSKKYDAASRLLTGYQFIAENRGQRNL